MSSATSRSPAQWNLRFEAWEKPASEHEEQQIERAASAVRDAVLQRPWIAAEGMEIRPQGSYHNNTNVRLQADVDLLAWHPSIRIIYEDGVAQAAAYQALGYSPTGHTFGELRDTIRTEIRKALMPVFGVSNIDEGNRAFTVRGIPNVRAPADVTPAFRLHYVVAGPSFSGPYRIIEGVYLLGRDGSDRLNFPEQHHANAIAKRRNTAHRYKRVVRTLKHLRDELVELGRIKAGTVPSYLIECIVYGVEDDYFLVEQDDRYQRLGRVVQRASEQSRMEAHSRAAREVNEVKFLYHPTQPWALGDVQTFLDLTVARLVEL